MKIVFAGGGTGGHFYPLIAVAEEINELVKAKRLVEAKLFYLADRPYDPRALYENSIEFRRITAGRSNFLGAPKIILGILTSIWQLYFIYPDVVFSKGGYVSFPVLWAARFLRLPVIIHDSDSAPGRVSLWSAKFAKRIALSYPEAASRFPPEKTAVVGNPIRRELLSPVSHGAYEFLHLTADVPTILILGGSQGAMTINDSVLDILPKLLERYQIIHQVGPNNLADVEKRASFILEQVPADHKARYKPFALLNKDALRMAAGIVALIISRGGSGAVFEFAAWGIPSIIIPIPEPTSHDQLQNAFTYARAGGAVVIEQGNLTPSILMSEINRLLGNPTLLEQMKKGSKSFARPEAGRLIAEQIIAIALGHES
ncbi:MAG: UDP-N-acetylglucosamine--N-acetylmuramyl-(pentapeptide) pyrophosphoryl-undecaprenol N-acetylglucosamine transferase [Candidatus Vogelbacteria bacterium]|nr:UDP-N-acetylglucosamine--N-acetylmuramyl-(pentapeptide) pyrophosphoryl-undecaprenol N-acetylglucosamine transferase [Candidatus Vogelbacteria bacterium]